MAAVSLAIVGRDDKPIYITEFPSKYHWKGVEDPIAEDELFGLSLSDGEEVPYGDDDFLNNCSLKQQFILHTALDRFVQVAGPPPGFMWRNPGATGTDAMFVGLLFPVDDLRCYGYVTATKIKIILVVEDDEMSSMSGQQAVDDRIKALMVRTSSEKIYVFLSFLVTS